MLNQINQIEETDIHCEINALEVPLAHLPSGDTCVLYVGDNLHLMKKIADEFVGKVDLCYIDPPYNTGSKFIYEDQRVSQKDNIWGTHLGWMEFMRPRLETVNSLLAETGIIAISIDDYEQPYLRVLMDQIFGQENFISCIATCRSNNGKSARGNVATNHEYIVVYGKSKKSKIRGFLENDDASYDKTDTHGKYRIDGLFRKKGDASLRTDRPNMYFPLYFDRNGNVFTERLSDDLKEVFPVDSKGVERRWLWGKDKAREESWKLYASAKGVVYVKNYFDMSKRVKPKSLWIDNRYLTERATNEIKEIYGDKIFETPKPISLIEDLIESHTHEQALILDFFAGTGTTAHAAHNLNKRDKGKRKVILMEQDQTIKTDHLAFKHGFRKISDITKARLEWIANRESGFTFQVKNIQ